MTRGNDFDKLRRMIETVATFIFEEVDRQYKEQSDPDFEFKFDEEG